MHKQEAQVRRAINGRIDVTAKLPASVLVALITGVTAGHRAMSKVDSEIVISRIADAVRDALFGPVKLPSTTDLAIALGVTVVRVGKLPTHSTGLTPRRWTSVVRGAPVAVIAGDVDDTPGWLVEDGTLEAAGVAVLLLAGIPEDRCLEDDLLDVATRIAGSILVPDAVISDIAGEARPYRENDTADEAWFESTCVRIVARTHAHEDLANDRLNGWLFSQLGDRWFVPDPNRDEYDDLTDEDRAVVNGIRAFLEAGGARRQSASAATSAGAS